MMYHLKRSLADGVSPSSGFWGSALFASSVMVLSDSRSTLLHPTQPVQRGLDGAAQHRVYNIEVGSKGEDGDDHDRRGSLHLFPRWSGHLAHFAAHIAKEVHRAGVHARQLVALA